MANSNYSDSSMKVFVSNIPFATTDDDLVELFSAAGAVDDAHVFRKDDGRSSGQAVIRFENADGAATALALDRTPFGNRTMRVPPWVDRCDRVWGAGRGWSLNTTKTR